MGAGPVTIRLYDLAGADPALRFSPHCWRTRLALAHKGLEVETIPWRFTEKEAIASSGQGAVPVLVDGDHVVSDSWAIALYLEDRYPDRPALFPEAGGKGEVQFVRAWTDRVLHTALAPVLMADIHACLAEEDKAYFRETREKRFGCTLEDLAAKQAESLAALSKTLSPLKATLATQPFVSGDRPAYADYLVFGAFQWARTVSAVPIVDADDPIHVWRDRMLGLFDGLAAAVPAKR